MFNPNVYVARRNRLRTLVSSGIVLFPGNPEAAMNYAANTYHYRQDSNFLYYFGLDHDGFAGVIDIVPAGVLEEMLGGNRAAGPRRLEAAGRRGIPQVITPCGFDMLSCGPLSRKNLQDPLWTTLRLHERKIFIPDEFRVQVRTRASELEKLAGVLAEKLNPSKGPISIILPALGWSSLSVPGADLFEPETDAVLAPALRSRLRPDIEVIEVEAAYDSPAVAELLVGKLEHLMTA